MEATRFGFVGLGMMGGPMAARVAGAGLALTVFDISRQATAPFAMVARTVAELAASCDVIMACLPSPEICLATVTELAMAPDRRVSVYVEMSTIGSVAVRAIAALLAPKGIAVLDAPISGGPKGAVEGGLTCMVAGPADALARARPGLDAFGRNLFHLAETPGLAQTMKLGNNLLAAANLAVTSEVVRMLEAAGIPLETSIAAINVSTGRNRASEVVFPNQILSGSFNQGARLDILAKDTELAVMEAEAQGCAATITRAVCDVWNSAKADGRGKQDITRIYDWAGRRQAE
jgi:3-hydroxyisobutyrate dehydrogenase-like beta-hydroxyacid dehydrogenase